MIKGIIALITRGILFNPMAWAGIGGACYVILNNFDPMQLAMNWQIHAGIFALAVVYTLIFKRVHHSGNNGVNWGATFKGMIARYIYVIFIAILTYVCFIGYQILVSEETQQKIRSTQNYRILSDEARSAYEAPKLPDEKF
ncbi:MAG: hypothetical protein Q4D80_05250 [Pseudomonadota bacterium]|nr:hypothetical protein [Pseudomonadota bacterium]